MSPSTSLCIAHLWATTCATPPAPMMSTSFLADVLYCVVNATILLCAPVIAIVLAIKNRNE